MNMKKTLLACAAFTSFSAFAADSIFIDGIRITPTFLTDGSNHYISSINGFNFTKCAFFEKDGMYSYKSTKLAGPIKKDNSGRHYFNLNEVQGEKTLAVRCDKGNEKIFSVTNNPNHLNLHHFENPVSYDSANLSDNTLNFAFNLAKKHQDTNFDVFVYATGEDVNKAFHFSNGKWVDIADRNKIPSFTSVKPFVNLSVPLSNIPASLKGEKIRFFVGYSKLGGSFIYDFSSEESSFKFKHPIFVK